MDTTRVIGSIVGLVILIYLCVDVWRSSASSGTKVLWTVFAFLCNLLTLVVWLVWGRRKAYAAPRR